MTSWAAPASHQILAMCPALGQVKGRLLVLGQSKPATIRVQLDELTRFLEAHKIQPSARPEVADVGATATVAEMQQRCKEIMQACMQCLNLDGPALERLVHTVRERCGPQLAVDAVL